MKRDELIVDGSEEDDANLLTRMTDQRKERPKLLRANLRKESLMTFTFTRLTQVMTRWHSPGPSCPPQRSLSLVNF